MSREMLGCREVWRGLQLRRQAGGDTLGFRDKQGTSSSTSREHPPRNKEPLWEWRNGSLGLAEETRAGRELLGTAMGMLAHPPGGK